jgi:hypothetical protein
MGMSSTLAPVKWVGGKDEFGVKWRVANGEAAVNNTQVKIHDYRSGPSPIPCFDLDVVQPDGVVLSLACLTNAAKNKAKAEVLQFYSDAEQAA